MEEGAMTRRRLRQSVHGDQALQTRRRLGSQPWSVLARGVWLAALLLGASGIVSAQTVTITEYPVPTVNSFPGGITAGPDGALWFTESETNKIGRITRAGVVTEYTVPTASTYPGEIAAGPDGALWFTEGNTSKIGRITTAGVIAEYPVPTANSQPLAITMGPDGALWFTEFLSSNIGRITTAGVITEYPVPDSYPGGITVGPDGALWFTESSVNRIGRITTAGVVTELLVPSGPRDITVGPDGALWYTGYFDSRIGRITTAGVITEYPVPTAGSFPEGITAGPDGALWFAEEAGSKIGRITAAGLITEYPVPTPNSGPFGITVGPDGALWFTEANGNNIGRASISSSTPSPGPPTPSAGSGLSQSFVFTFSDQAGWQDLDVVNILINSVLDGRNSCYLAYSRSGGVLYLVNDAGTALLAGLPLNGAGSVGNSQCTVIGVGSSAAGSGNTLTLTLNMSFSASFAGNKVIYLAARDLQANNSGWQALGTWNVPGVTPSGPSVNGMSPASSYSLAQTYTFTFSDTNGWQDIAVANVLINSGIDGRHACFLAFVPSSAGGGSVLLVDDAGDGAGPYSGVVLPGTGIASNSQCAIAGAGSSVSAAGNTLTLTLVVTFAQSFAGNQVVYAAARSVALSSGWQAVGSVTVP